MSEFKFYENVFEVTQDILKCQVVPWALRKLILEMDESLRKWRTERENDVKRGENNEDVDYMRIDSRKLDEIYEIFKGRTVQRDKYLDVYPKYEENTLKTIKELKDEADDLSESLELLNLPNQFANAAGALSGGLRLLSLATSFSPGLSLVMNVASVTNGAVRSVTTVAEHMVNECHLGKAVESIENHKSQFKDMSRWFTYDDCLIRSIKAAVGSESSKALFEKFREICHKLDNFKQDHPLIMSSLNIIEALSKVLLQADFTTSVAYFVTTALFQIFWLHYSTYCMTDWSIGAIPFERLKSLSLTGMYGAHAYLGYRRLVDPCNSFYSTNPVGAAVGIAIDLIPPLLDAKKKKGKSATRDQVKNINNVVKKLKEEMNVFKHVYNTLKAEKALEED